VSNGATCAREPELWSFLHLGSPESQPLSGLRTDACTAETGCTVAQTADRKVRNAIRMSVSEAGVVVRFRADRPWDDRIPPSL
jgi:hypothetical protein